MLSSKKTEKEDSLQLSLASSVAPPPPPPPPPVVVVVDSFHRNNGGSFGRGPRRSFSDQPKLLAVAGLQKEEEEEEDEEEEELGLNQTQRDSLARFRLCLDQSGTLRKRESDRNLLRFLQARSFDVTKAKLMYQAMLEWRKEIGADSIIESFSFPEYKTIKVLYPHFHHKTDKFGRPVYIERIGMLNLEEILKVTTMERMLLYHIKEWEVLINRKFPACSKKAGRTISHSLSILDLKGVALKHMNKQVRNFIQEISKIDQDYYPEYLGKMLIVNAPMGFKAIWMVIKPWLEKQTQSKIEVHGSNFSPKLLELVDAENLPEFLGGCCKCPGGCENLDAGPWNEPPILP